MTAQVAVELQLDGIGARHPMARRGTSALSGVDLRIGSGARVALIGPSGAGKTTLLQLAAAALRPSAGRLRIGGVDPWSLGASALRRVRGRLVLAPQTPPMPPRQRVVTSVLAARLPAWSLWTSVRSLFYPADIEGAEAALARLDLADKLFERVDRLSGGERQRVGLARVLIAPASLWLIDEPLSALDPTRAAQALAALLAVARERGATVLVSLHQVDAALANFDRVLGLRGGRLLFDLPAGEVSRTHLRELYAQHEHELATGPAAMAEPSRAIPMLWR